LAVYTRIAPRRPPPYQPKLNRKPILRDLPIQKAIPGFEQTATNQVGDEEI
jgi:hypothetical protein